MPTKPKPLLEDRRGTGLVTAPASVAPTRSVAAPVYSAEIVDTLAAIDRFAGFHRAHQAHPESHFDLLRASMQNGRAATPFFVMVSRDGAPCLLMVGQAVQGRLRWRLGYRTIHASPARTIEVLQGGWLGDCSRPCVEFLCDHLYARLRRGGVDAIHLRHVPDGSELLRVFASRPQWPWRDRHPSRSTNWQLRVPASFEQWQRAQTKREREDTKRYDKRIRQQFGDAVRVERLTRPEDVDRAAALLEGIARKTYQRGMGAGYRDTPQERARWRAAAAARALDVRLLWFGGQPVAFCIGFRLQATLWLEHLGYDPAYRRFRPGMFLLLRLIEDVARDGDVQTIDFGVGDADYKRRLCDQSQTNASVYLFAPTLRGLWLNSLRTLADAVSTTGQACLDRLGLLPWLKRRWRRALQPTESTPRED
jgi:hypothetical protein